jgi:Coenzyme PQQ synthesis protein D (PqqD)
MPDLQQVQRRGMKALQSSSTSTTPFDTVPVHAQDVSEELLDGELLLYHRGETRAIYLNPTATIIWMLCDGKRPVQEIVDLIRESYPDANPELADDVLVTLTDLRDNHVLMWS